MIRFVPDTWVEALLRPVAMALPNGSVYVETIAPDLRFVMAVALAFALLGLGLRRRLQGFDVVPRRMTWVLFGFCALAFAPWLATSGNGRYFIAVLLLVGPLTVALAYALPLSRGARLGTVGLLLALQAFLVWEVDPRNSWSLVPWNEAPAFGVDVPEDLRATPATYVVLGGISYSLIAPAFHPDSRWIGVSVNRPDDQSRSDGRRIREALAMGGPLRLVTGSLPGETELARPPEALVEALDESLVPWGVRVRPEACRILRSAGLTAFGRGDRKVAAPPDAPQRGFWVCDLQRTGGNGAPRKLPPLEVEAAFRKIEATCPRLFPPGAAATLMLPFGARRAYSNSDMRLYILEDGRIMYKYMRALNMELVGTIDGIVSGRQVIDCRNVRGRAGLPWEREI